MIYVNRKAYKYSLYMQPGHCKIYQPFKTGYRGVLFPNCGKNENEER